ncbi:MAG: hypothetical protein AB7F43_13675 [Bacteriovoracia bacterium]
MKLAGKCFKKNIGLVQMLFAVVFVPSNFPPSVYHAPFATKHSNSRFSTWAAEQTTETLNSFKSGKSFREALSQLAKKRTELQQAITAEDFNYQLKTDTKAELFGKPRTKNYTHTLGWGRNAVYKNKSPEVDSLAAIVEQYGSLRDASLNGCRTALLRETEYLSIDGIFLIGTKIHRIKDPYTYGLIQIQNGSHQRVESVLEDIFKRLELAVSVGRKQKAIQIASAAYGYYQATPYFRGTAAIGRVYWSAVATFILGKQVIVPGDIDIRAFILKQNEFVDWLAPILLSKS